MAKQFTDRETSEMGKIRSEWESTPNVTSVEEIFVGFDEVGKWVSGRVFVQDGRRAKGTAFDLQEKAFGRIPDMRSFSVVITDADQKTVEFVWEVGNPWQERVYPAGSSSVPKDEF